MSVRRPALAAALACAVVLTTPSVADSAPPPVRCGSVLTTGTALRHDLTCSGDGLVLRPGVTLDLRGHTLRSTAGGVGVLVSSEGEVVLRNGTITGWDTGVDVLGADLEADRGPLTVDRVRFRDNATGVDASGENGTGLFRKPTTITRSDFVGHTRMAVDGGWFAEVDVDRSTFTANTVGLWTAGDATVRRSRFVRNEQALNVTEAVLHVEDSVFQDNPRAVTGYIIGTISVVGSRFTGSDVAVHGAGTWLDVTSSTFVSNARAVVLGWQGGSIADNVLRANGEAITLDGDLVDLVTVEGNVLRGNGEGIVLDAAPGAVRAGTNDVRGSAGRGIYVPGATDLGGNTARGNGTEPQCVGVVCSRS